jgi:group I intron endonuclease
MNITGIYKIISPTNKIYIGQSTNIKSRWSKYYNYKCNKQPKIFNSFKKYNVETHKFEIIEECVLEKLNERELYWKQYYLNLYGWKNMLFHQLIDNRGDCMKGKKHSEKTKQKMVIAHTGRKDSNETKLKKSQSHLGIVKSKEWRKKIGENHSSNKPIFKYDVKHNLIKEYKSINEASRKNNIGVTAISNCCIRNSKKEFGECTSFNYIWKYKI